MKYLILILLYPFSVLSCSNGIARVVYDNGSIEHYIDEILRKEHVFKAILVSAEKSPSKENYTQYKFEMSDVIKGSPRQFNYLYSAIRGTSCDGIKPTINTEYLFYINSDYINHANLIQQDYLESIDHGNLAIRIRQAHNNKLDSDRKKAQNN